MNWLILVLAGLLEVGWAVGLKYSEGFTQLVPSVLTVLSMAASVFLLGVAIKTLPLGTAYVIWVGIGAVGTAIVGMLLFSEPVSFLRVASLFLIVIGVVGLKFSHGG
jgi:quaternary ammonium compound-resistance protein SugE